MISTFTADAARRHENLKFVVIPLPLNTVNGQLANFEVENSDGYIVADFVGKPTGRPRECFGPVKVWDGMANVVLDIPNATIQFEAGMPEGPWSVIAGISITGIDTTGRFWVIRSNGAPDETSLPIEGAVSSLSGLAGLVELAKWAKP